MIKGADLKLFEKGVTCTCKVQGKGEYPISQGGLPLESDCVGRANYEKVDWRIYSLFPTRQRRGKCLWGKKGISYGPPAP